MRKHLLVSCIPWLLIGCGNLRTSPHLNRGPVGGWVSVEFTVTDSTNAVTDVLQAGGILVLGLNADSTTVGQLTIPASLNGGTALTADMAGTWTMHGDTVLLVQAADTFVRDMPFVFTVDNFEGTRTFSRTTVHVRFASTSI